MSKNKQGKKRIALTIMGGFLLLNMGIHQVRAANEGTASAEVGIQFVRDEEEKPDGSSEGAVSGNQNGSSQLSIDQKDQGKNRLPATGEIASNSIFSLIGLGFVLYLAHQKYKRSNQQ